MQRKYRFIYNPLQINLAKRWRRRVGCYDILKRLNILMFQMCQDFYFYKQVKVRLKILELLITHAVPMNSYE